MMTQQLGFTVLSAPVALCDRRALSQAWYSALHLHKERSGAPFVRGRDSTQADSFAHTHASPGPSMAMPRGSFHRAVSIGAALALPGPPAHERRLLPSKLAQRIERAFAAPKSPPKHAAFSLEGGRGRVQILLRSNGGQTQLVALCPAAARDVVARALAQARYALALRGITIAADVRGFAQ